MLAQLTIEERTRLLTAAGDIYCPDLKERRAGVDKAKEFRLHFLRGLKPEHPLHDTPEARVARGEAVEWQIANGR